jgi:hypothetical protein
LGLGSDTRTMAVVIHIRTTATTGRIIMLGRGLTGTEVTAFIIGRITDITGIGAKPRGQQNF